MIVLALAALIAAALIISMIHAHVRQHGAGVLLYRWFTGLPLDGRARTDARWFASGSKALTPTGYASRWHHRPRAVRAGIRTGATLAAIATGYGLAVNRAATLYGLAGAGLVLTGLGAWSAWRAGRAWRHHRAWVKPLHVALGRALGVPRSTRPASWLEVPRGYQATEGAVITAWLPDHFVPGADTKKAVRELVCAKLALEDPREHWALEGKRPHVTFTVQVPPPDRVTFASVAELVRKAAAHAPLIGLGRAGRPVYADLDQDSPHACVSMGSGGGKSVTTRALVSQILAKGGVALILDVKRLSHAWARGLPNVKYCRDIAEIHDALIWLGGELDKRNAIADEGADAEGNTDHVDVGPRLVVLAEEMNATANRLAAYWRKIKSKDDPAVSPATEALADALFMGRQVRVNVFAVAQMLTARTIGGGEARENMGVRILARYTLNNWRVLVPEIWPPPRASRHRGRMQVCVAGRARETQGAFFTPAEARELALSGTVSKFPATGPLVPAARPTLHLAGTRPPIGLAEAVRLGVVPIGLEAVRKARQRDSEFPASVGEGQGGELLYDSDELAAWARNRPRAAASV